MTDSKTARQSGGWKGVLPGLLVSLGAIFLLSKLIDLDAFTAALRLVDLRYIPLVGLLFVGTLAARAMAWRTLLQRKISISRSFWTVNEGYLFNNVLPFRLGEVARGFLLSRTTSITFWEAFSTIMVERVFDVAILAGILMGTVPFVIGAEWALQAAYGAGVVVLVGFVVLFWLARNVDTTLSLFERFTAPWPRLTGFGRDKLAGFLSGLSALTTVGEFAKVFFWIAVAWIFNITWYVILLDAFSMDISLFGAVFMVGVIALGVAAPSSPAFIGVFEAVTVGALALFGFDYNISLAYAVTAHSVYFVITVALGAIALGRDGQSLGEVYRWIRTRRIELEAGGDASE